MDISISNFISSVNNALNDNTRSLPPHHPPSLMQTKSFHMRDLLSLSFSLFHIKCVSISSESHHHNQHKHSSTNNKQQTPHTHINQQISHPHLTHNFIHHQTVFTFVIVFVISILKFTAVHLFESEIQNH